MYISTKVKNKIINYSIFIPFISIFNDSLFVSEYFSNLMQVSSARFFHSTHSEVQSERKYSFEDYQKCKEHTFFAYNDSRIG